MSAAFVIDASGAVTATSKAAGPWNELFCHGGAPGALVTRAAERVPTLVPMEVARVTCELIRPVPVGPVEVTTEIIRQGKKIQLVDVRLNAGDVEVLRANILKLRTADQPELAGLATSLLDRPAFSDGVVEQSRVPDRFGSLFTLSTVSGSFREAGPAALWFRLDQELVADEVASPSMCAVAAADFTNGISTPVSFTDWTFLNADLTVSFARAPIGRMILVDGATITGGSGRAVAQSRLGDEAGWFGHATQSLLFERR